jgi:hypothetical protein
MKITLVAIAIVSSLLVGCDRQILKGLNIKFQGEIKSDYQDSESQNQDSSPSNSAITENNPSNQEKSNNLENDTPEVFRNQPLREVKRESTSDPDAPLAFKPLKDCSDAGITAKTNELFYAANPNLKSINSQDREKVAEWKSIYNQVKGKCQ